jgi:hypothetical protein
MTKAAFLSIILLVCMVPIGAQIKDAYPPGVPPPPPSMDPDHAKAASNEPRLQRRVDPLKLQREADDLARIAQTIPSDIASIRGNMLPKDTLEKLKEIEKLSKRLRSELNP